MTLPLPANPKYAPCQDNFDEIAQRWPIGTGDLAQVPTARVYNSAAIGTVTGVGKLLTFDSEHWDHGGLHSLTANTSRLTAPVPGIYVISATVEFATNAVGQRTVLFQTNGANVVAAQQINATAGGVNHIFTLTHQAQFLQNDYVEVIVSQTSGGNLNVNSTAFYSPEFAMTFVSNG